MSYSYPSNVAGYALAQAQKITTSGTSAATTNAVGSDKILVFAGGEDVWISFGPTPTAAADTAGSIFLGAHEKIYIGVKPDFKVAAIQDTEAGSVHVIPLTSVGD